MAKANAELVALAVEMIKKSGTEVDGKPNAGRTKVGQPAFVEFSAAHGAPREVRDAVFAVDDAVFVAASMVAGERMKEAIQAAKANGDTPDPATTHKVTVVTPGGSIIGKATASRPSNNPQTNERGTSYGNLRGTIDRTVAVPGEWVTNFKSEIEDLMK